MIQYSNYTKYYFDHGNLQIIVRVFAEYFLDIFHGRTLFFFWTIFSCQLPVAISYFS